MLLEISVITFPRLPLDLKKKVVISGSKVTNKMAEHRRAAATMP